MMSGQSDAFHLERKHCQLVMTQVAGAHLHHQEACPAILLAHLEDYMELLLAYFSIKLIPVRFGKG